MDGLSPQLLTALGRVLPKTDGEAVSLLTAGRHATRRTSGSTMSWAGHCSGLRQTRRGARLLPCRPGVPARGQHGPQCHGLDRWASWAGGTRPLATTENPSASTPETAALPHNNLGIALEAKGRMDEAIGHCQDAIRLEPTARLGPQ